MSCKNCIHIEICEKLRPIEYCMDKGCSNYLNNTDKCKDCGGCTNWFCDYSNIYQQCVEDIKVFYKENRFDYEAQKLGEELDEFLEKHFKKQENIIINKSTEYDL